MIAQLGWPDMRLPLLYSIAWPHRIAMPSKKFERPLSLVELGSMTFKVRDYLQDETAAFPLSLTYFERPMYARTGGHLFTQ